MPCTQACLGGELYDHVETPLVSIVTRIIISGLSYCCTVGGSCLGGELYDHVDTPLVSIVTRIIISGLSYCCTVGGYIKLRNISTMVTKTIQVKMAMGHGNMFSMA